MRVVLRRQKIYMYRIVWGKNMLFHKKIKVTESDEWMPFLVLVVGQACSLKCK